MPIAGTWLRLGAGEFDGDEILDRPDVIDASSDLIVNDLFWDTQGPPPVTEIPYSWLSQPLAFRSDLLRNVATVTRTDGAESQQSDAASVGEFGEVEFTAELDTAIDVDPVNLGSHILTYFATQANAVPRQRIPTLTLDLLQRTDLERWKILGRQIGDRIRVTGAPATWPEGASTGVIEGISHFVDAATRTVRWNLAAVVGSAPGISGPWFRLDTSMLDGTNANVVTDTFSRVVSNGWGSADSGQAWSITAGAAGDFAVDTRGTMSHSAVSDTHSIVVPLGLVDVDVRIDTDTNIGFLTGGNLVSVIDFRRIDANNYFRLYVRWKPAGNLATAELVRVLGGTPTTIAAETTIPGVTSTSSLTVRVRAVGTVFSGVSVQAKAWLAGAAEPDWLLTAVDFTIDAPGDLQAGSFRDVGNTNSPTVFRFDNLTVVDPRLPLHKVPF